MFSKDRAILWFLLFSAVQIAQASQYREHKTIISALKQGKPSLDFRLRHEETKQETLTSAQASTMRSVLGYQSASFYQNYISLEVINVSNFFSQHYNPDVAPLRKPGYAVIADPKGTGVTNANITYQCLPHTDIILGRQYIFLDNERMVGYNDFRQYRSNFDAITIKNDFFKNFEIYYSFLDHINTVKNNSLSINGRHKLRSNLFNITWQDFIYGQITAYSYINKDLSVNTNSQNTYGLRVKSDELFNKTYTFDYELEVARQQNKSNNPNKYSVGYFSAVVNKDIIELFNSWLIAINLGYELLGGHDGGAPGRTFIFPLGSLYGFNGLAEGYTSTPDRGLQDYNAGLEFKYSEIFKLITTFHLFKFAAGTEQKLAGREIDLSMVFNINKDCNAQIRLAKLNAKNYSTLSVRRVSGQLSYFAL